MVFRGFLLSMVVFIGAAAYAGGGEMIGDVVYGHKDGMALTLDVLKPDGPQNGIGILFIMSSGWGSEWNPPEVVKPWFSRLHAKGFTVFVVRHGSVTRYALPEIHSDIVAAAGFIREHAAEYGIDPDRLGATSFSAGAHLSLLLALVPQSGEVLARGNNGIGAVVAFCPPVDLTRPILTPEGVNLTRKLGKFDHKAMSPIRLVSPDAPPTLLLVGDQDWLYHGVVRMHKALQASGVATDLIVYPGGNHAWTDPEQKAAAEEAMVAWFERHLVRKE